MINEKLSHSPTLPLSHSPTLPLSHSPTLPLSHSPTLPLYPHPVLFSFPFLFAQYSTCPKTHNPKGIITTPINKRVASSGRIAEIGAPTNFPVPSAGELTPISLRQAESA